MAALGTDPYANQVLDAIRKIGNSEIVSLSDNDEQPDLIVSGLSDLSDPRLSALVANNTSSVLIASQVCQPMDQFLQLAPARLRKGRFVQISGQRRLVPELISLSEIIQERFGESHKWSGIVQTESRPHKVRVFSGWAAWIDPLT
jgi:hypothetical protein